MTALACDVAVIGAGPYGLAAAAHLRAAGVHTQTFGEEMGFWRTQMPAGMLLISSWHASHIADPNHALTLDAYEQAHRVSFSRPVPLDDFAAYGQWFQRQAVPDLERRQVLRVEPSAPGFRLVLDDGEVRQARRVVIATGLAPFVWRPAAFADLPPTLASHSADHRELDRFAGQRIAVIGGGQSALTSAVLLHQAGAEVELVVREQSIRWIQRKLYQRKVLSPLRRLLYAPTDVGPAGLSRIVGLPGLYRRIPFALRDRLGTRAIRPAGAPWLRPQLDGVRISTARTVVSAAPVDGLLRLTLNDGTERRVDHAMLATGYRIDVARFPFFDPSVVDNLRQVNGYPVLKGGFESSVPGLHFIGAPAAASFGPTMRFVSGTTYTARALTRAAVGGASVRGYTAQPAPATLGQKAGQ